MGSKTNKLICGFCQIPITPQLANKNFCAECNASYCSVHYDWSQWNYIHLVTETMIRYGTCPKGHRKEETDPS